MYDPQDITLVITTEEGQETVTIPFDFSDFTEEYDPQDITLVITTEEGQETVTIPFDFSDFTEEETLRVRTLNPGEADVARTMSAFLFIAVCRQVPFDNDAFEGFHSEMSRLWDHDPSILEVV